MPKRSYKMPSQPVKENTGCMWGIINLFDFRQVPATPRLTNRKKRDGEGYSRISLDSRDSVSSKHGNEVSSISEKIDVNTASVKALIEEEMSEELSKKKIPINEIQESRSETNPRKNCKLRNKKCKVKTSDANVENLINEGLDDHEVDGNTKSTKSSHNFDLASLLIEIYSYNNDQESSVDSNKMVKLCTALKTISEKMHDNVGEPDSLLCQKYRILKKALVDVEEAIANRNPIHEKQFIGHKCAQSKELLDAFKILNLNKELLLKLLRDPESLLLNHDEDFLGNQVEKTEKIQLLERKGSSEKRESLDGKELLHKRTKYNFFQKKDNTKEMKPLNDDQDPGSLSRIVVLRTNRSTKEKSLILIDPIKSPQLHHTATQEVGERAFPYFSVNEIKRKLKRVFGASRKGRHAISRDGVLDKIPIDRKNSIKSDRDIVLQSPRVSLSTSSAIGRDTSKRINLEESELGIENDVARITAGESICREAKKHLVEMLDAGVQTDDLPTYETSKPLVNFLHLPDYTESPRSTPVRHKGIVSSLKQTGHVTLEQLMLEDVTSHVIPSIQSLKVSPYLGIEPVVEVNMNKEHVGAHMKEDLCTGENRNDEGSLVIAEADDINRSMVSNQLDAVFGTENDEPDQHKEESSTASQPVLSDDKLLNFDQSEVSSPRFFVTENPLVAERKTMKSYREDSLAFRENFVKEARVQIQPRKNSFNDNGTFSKVPKLFSSEILNDNEVRSRYTQAVLGASGLSEDEFSKIWLSEDQLVDPSLVDKVGISYFPVEDDRKLLFDCINEVLVEIQWRYFRFNPTLSFAKPNIQPAPFGKKLIKEVKKGLKRHLGTQFPNTKEQIIEKDLSNGSWMDLRLEIEDIVIDIWDSVLEDLVDECVFDLWF